MSYKSRVRRTSIRIKVFFITSIIFFLLTLSVYVFDRLIVPNVIANAKLEMEALASEIFFTNALEIYRDNFNYEDFFHIEKDEQGYITMLSTNTMEMNYLSALVASRSQADIRQMGGLGVEFPLGYLSKNNLLAVLGPKIKVKMLPMGAVKTSYSSSFETAGINQTKHKIYLEVATRIKVILPFNSSEILYIGEIPVIETVIVGRVPRTNIGIQGLEIK